MEELGDGGYVGINCSASSTPQTPITPLPLLKSSFRHDNNIGYGHDIAFSEAGRGGDGRAPNTTNSLNIDRSSHKSLLSRFGSACGSCGFEHHPMSHEDNTMDLFPGACSVPSISLTRKVLHTIK